MVRWELWSALELRVCAERLLPVLLQTVHTAHGSWTRLWPSSFCPCPHVPTTPYPRAQHKGLPDTHILFPLYCSSTGLEVCLDLQRALKRLRGWGQGQPGMRETGRRGDTGRCCLEVITVIPEDYQDTISGKQGKRGNGHSVSPCPYRDCRFGKQPVGRYEENVCCETTSPPWLLIRPRPYHTHFSHLKHGANREK